MSELVQSQVGEKSEHLITKMRFSEAIPAVGNVVRRECVFVKKGACQETCQLIGTYAMYDDDLEARKIVDTVSKVRICADLNLKSAIEKAGLLPDQVLMVGVTANVVGFGDQLDQYEDEGKLKNNHYGWRELPGFNAFFARTTEVPALGRRLADCADINFEFQDTKGNTVIGFEHGTRENMFGESEYKFETGGKKVSFTEFALSQAIEHYGADPASIRIKLAAAIQGHNFIKYFNSRDKMEGHIPGWYAAGYLKNITNPNWQPGDPIIESDAWEADSRGMIVDDIKKAMEVLGVPLENFNMDGIIDPADSKGVHSSHEFKNKYGDTRDLYLIYKAKTTSDE